MDIDTALRILFCVIVVGFAVKAIKFVAGTGFKIALILFIVLLIYKTLI
ncbi:hypothetical protein [Asaccharospora irregularis]|uniref:Uncharacterized protein n=1 Tax=Asaccharospora irregularis DSM 2635 TaxID=1121321 RepID=A0A1M5KK87_9FIRM|nr:hypothetical protein [Asaccharospora irregularis]SHG53262.1 hypothetical protein SAMN04488530_10314 [Asaccharospora irregularis DSM 2635]